MLDADIGVAIVRTNYHTVRFQEIITDWWGTRTVYNWQDVENPNRVYASFYFNPSFGVNFNAISIFCGYKMWTAKYREVPKNIPPNIFGQLVDLYEKQAWQSEFNGAFSFKISIDVFSGIR